MEVKFTSLKYIHFKCTVQCVLTYTDSHYQTLLPPQIPSCLFVINPSPYTQPLASTHLIFMHILLSFPDDKQRESFSSYSFMSGSFH